MAGSTGLEPATSGLTVQCANQAPPRARTYHPRSPKTLTRGVGRVNATGRTRPSERKLTAVVGFGQLDLVDAELAFLRKHREDRGHGAFRQPQLAGDVPRAHRPG